MTMYEPNPDVREAGAEGGEFVDAPEPHPAEPPAPSHPDPTADPGGPSSAPDA